MARIGTVENDEPIPNVISKPINSIQNAAKPWLSPIHWTDACTKAGTWFVASITDAKPCAEIIMKPTNAIIRIPCTKTSSASCHLKIPAADNTAKPTKPPRIIESEYNCATSVKTMNLGAKSYSKGNAVYSQLSKYIDALAGFNGKEWAGNVVKGSDIKSKVLEVGIPRGATSAQVQQINKAIETAASKNIQMNVRVVK